MWRMDCCLRLQVRRDMEQAGRSEGPNPANPTATDAWAGVKAKAAEVAGRAKDSAERVVEGAKGAWEGAKQVSASRSRLSGQRMGRGGGGTG